VKTKRGIFYSIHNQRAKADAVLVINLDFRLLVVGSAKPKPNSESRNAAQNGHKPPSKSKTNRNNF